MVNLKQQFAFIMAILCVMGSICLGQNTPRDKNKYELLEIPAEFSICTDISWNRVIGGFTEQNPDYEPYGSMVYNYNSKNYSTPNFANHYSYGNLIESVNRFRISTGYSWNAPLPTETDAFYSTQNGNTVILPKFDKHAHAYDAMMPERLGIIVGSAQLNTETHAVYWSIRSSIGINDIHPEQLHSSVAKSILENGMVAGWGTQRNGINVGVFWKLNLDVVWEENSRPNGPKDHEYVILTYPNSHVEVDGIDSSASHLYGMIINNTNHPTIWDINNDFTPSILEGPYHEMGGILDMEFAILHRDFPQVGLNVAVGWSYDPETNNHVATVWKRDSSGTWVGYDLNKLIDNLDGWKSLNVAYAINQFGDIVGSGIKSNGIRAGFLITPVLFE